MNITDIDIFEDRRIILNSTLTNVSREPDGVVWLGKKSEFFATADEGDFQGGSRSFTVFNENGEIAFSSGNLLELLAVRLGHYPDERSENRGVEPENLAYGQFQNCEMLFVQSERASLTYVFEVSNASNPKYLQALPAIRTPERGRTIPRRNLYITASEDSDLDLDIRSGLNIYQCQSTQYPFLESGNVNGLPIPWGSIAGLTGEGNDTLWAVEGAFFAEPQILRIQSTRHPPRINRAISITYPNGTFLQNLNISGIDINDEGFVIVDQTTESLLLLNNNGVLQDSFAINSSDAPSGVAYDPDVGYVVTTYGGTVIVCNLTTPVCGEKNFTYPLDAPESQDGGVVALRDIAALGDGHFLFLETDGQGGFDAAVRRIYKAELPEGNETVIEKTLVEDFLLELQEPYTTDKITLWVVNDNGGTDDTNGETQLLPLIQHVYQCPAGKDEAIRLIRSSTQPPVAMMWFPHVVCGHRDPGLAFAICALAAYDTFRCGMLAVLLLL
ncbi:unnamed protein product [Symbiodinium sp. KB8]|nr:unnamed protein product [Symbiodinium sp. KB8]